MLVRLSTCLCLTGSLLFLSSADAVTPKEKPTIITTSHISNAQNLSAINQKAQLARHGDRGAIAAITDSMFASTGVPKEVVAALNLRQRIIQAEVKHQSGGQSAIHETDIVRAVNNLNASFGGPAWANTSQQEVRRLRMRLLVLYPNLFASSNPPDSKGQYEAVSVNMSH